MTVGNLVGGRATLATADGGSAGCLVRELRDVVFIVESGTEVEDGDDYGQNHGQDQRQFDDRLTALMSQPAHVL